MSRERMTQLNLWIPRELERNLRVEAARLDFRISEYLEALLRRRRAALIDLEVEARREP